MATRLNKEFFDFSYVRRTLKIIWTCSKKLTVARFALLLIQAILPLIPLYLMKILLDSFVGVQPPSFEYIIWILVGFAIVQILIIITTNVSSYVVQNQTDIISDHISEIVINKAVHIDFEYFDSDSYHDIFQRAINQSSIRPTMVLNALSQLVQSAISLLVIAALLITLHWAVAIILLIIALPIAFIRLIYSNKMVGLVTQQTQQERKAQYFRNILVDTQDAKEVRTFGFGKYLLAKFLKIRRALRKEKRQVYLNQNMSLSYAQSIEAISIVAALAFIAQKAIKGLISVGDIAMYFGAFQKGQVNINTALRSMVIMHENKKYLEHLFKFLDLEQKITDHLPSLQAPDKILQLKVNNLSFAYPNTTKKVIDNVSFNVNKGEILAIVGENGSGKSTLVKLINRLYDPTAGQIFVNDVEITSINQFEYRKKLSVLFQSFSRYNASVTENIHLADVDKPMDIKKIEQSSLLGLSSEFINDLPLKYKTRLGRTFRNGEELSGGQWQKIALSRAFYKNADIIILDEPTSFIDPIAEDEIFENLNIISKNKIIILITHRIYNLKQADKIIVLSKGKIIEHGNHDELIVKDGLYKSMFDNQN